MIFFTLFELHSASRVDTILDMEIRTKTYEITTHFAIDCRNSTVAERVVVIAQPGNDEVVVIVNYRNGAEWSYIIPLIDFMALIGEKSVGRFVNGVKRVAVYSRDQAVPFVV
jgi:hypothetical protein